MKRSSRRWMFALVVVLILGVAPVALYNSVGFDWPVLDYHSEQPQNQSLLSEDLERSITDTDALVEPSVQHAEVLDGQTEAEFRLANVKQLMATPLTGLTSMQKQMIVQQILDELPFLVGSGELHPFDATLAHVKASAYQQKALQEYEVEALRDEYIAMYPSDIRIQSHPEH